MSGGLPASMAATNFCSRSPKVAQSISTSTFFSLAQVSTCLATTSLPGVTTVLKSPGRRLVLAWAEAMPRSACRPAAVPAVTIAAFRRNSRRAMRPASSCSARFLRRLSMEAPPLERGAAVECGGDDRMLTQGGAPGKETVRGARDGGGVDAVVAVEIAAGARLAEGIHPQRQLAGPQGPPPGGPRGGVAGPPPHPPHAPPPRPRPVEYPRTGIRRDP